MSASATTRPSKLAQLRDMTVVVADTGDAGAIERLKPVDCTTNPTLVRKALDLPVYAPLIERELERAATLDGDVEQVARQVADRLTIGVGVHLSGLVPGRVSTEVDADLSHDTGATVAKAHDFIALYEAAGGFPPVAEHEDVRLVEAVRALAEARVRATDTTRVLTSSRLTGRTPGGFAGHLQEVGGEAVPRRGAQARP